MEDETRHSSTCMIQNRNVAYETSLQCFSYSCKHTHSGSEPQASKRTIEFMADRTRDKSSAEGSGVMELKIIGKDFATQNRKDPYLDVTAMVRSIQRVSGGDPCFRTGRCECDRKECEWRRFCLEF
jgi:hypothetical protein